MLLLELLRVLKDGGSLLGSLILDILIELVENAAGVKVYLVKLVECDVKARNHTTCII